MLIKVRLWNLVGDIKKYDRDIDFLIVVGRAFRCWVVVGSGSLEYVICSYVFK